MHKVGGDGNTQGYEVTPWMMQFGKNRVMQVKAPGILLEWCFAWLTSGSEGLGSGGFSTSWVCDLGLPVQLL